MTKILTSLILLLSLTGFADRVIMKDDKVHEGSKIAFQSKQGRIIIYKEGGLKQPLKLEDIKAIDAPKPGSLRKLESLFYVKKDYKKIVASVKGKPLGLLLVNHAKAYGWGHKAAYLYSLSLLKQGNESEAYRQAALAKASYIKRLGKDQDATALADLALVHLYVAQGNVKKAKRRLRELKGKIDSLKGYYFNASAIVFKKEGLENPALLEYYKSIFLDSMNVGERLVAIDSAIAIIGPNKPRSQLLAEMKKNQNK